MKIFIEKMDNSEDSDNSSRNQEGKRGKIESLYKAFNDLNWDSKKDLTDKEILFFELAICILSTAHLSAASSIIFTCLSYAF